ncbi:MAG: glycosyltransferase [Dehalococcoidia bacterium]|nr:glycosyltransferase [Dehalococcoidia bacterium]
MRVAIVHDWLNQRGGAEEVLEVLRSMFPQAPIFTSIFSPQAMPEAYRSWPVRTSFLQHLPAVDRYHRALLPIYPLAFRLMDLSDYDLVISNSSGFCHGVSTRKPQCHINYCLTPPRYAWNLDQYMEREQLGTAVRAFLPLTARFLRRWDLRAARRIGHFVAISRAVEERINRFYGRGASVIHPPVNTADFTVMPDRGEYFLVVSRLVPYKRIDLAVSAFSKLGWPLVVVGEGRDRASLERMAGPSIRFLGWRPRSEVRDLMARCRAFIFPGEEDFGIAPVEAQAAGRPVIAFAGGGALETVLEGTTGILFHATSPESLTDAASRFSVMETSFDPHIIQAQARRFDTTVFKDKILALIAERLGTAAVLEAK